MRILLARYFRLCKTEVSQDENFQNSFRWSSKYKMTKIQNCIQLIEMVIADVFLNGLIL